MQRPLVFAAAALCVLRYPSLAMARKVPTCQPNN